MDLVCEVRINYDTRGEDGESKQTDVHCKNELCPLFSLFAELTASSVHYVTYISQQICIKFYL